MPALRELDGAGVSVFAWDGEGAAGLLPEGGDYTVHQGVEMGRPSRLDGSVVAAGGAAVSASVRGGVVPVATGRVRRS